MKIERKQLKEIEFIFRQSAQGVHLLFDDREKLVHILSRPVQEKIFFDSKNMEKLQEVFTRLISEKSLKDKQVYLKSLSAEYFEIFARAYFHIVENSILTQDKLIH